MTSSPDRRARPGREPWRDELLAGIVWLHAVWFGLGFVLLFLFPPIMPATSAAFLLAVGLAWRARGGRLLAATGLAALIGLELVWPVYFLATEDGRDSSIVLPAYAYLLSMTVALAVAVVVVVRTARGG